MGVQVFLSSVQIWCIWELASMFPFQHRVFAIPMVERTHAFRGGGNSSAVILLHKLEESNFCCCDSELMDRASVSSIQQLWTLACSSSETLPILSLAQTKEGFVLNWFFQSKQAQHRDCWQTSLVKQCNVPLSFQVTNPIRSLTMIDPVGTKPRTLLHAGTNNVHDYWETFILLLTGSICSGKPCDQQYSRGFKG